MKLFKTLVDEDWDFSDIASAELPLCLEYEYCRHLSDLIKRTEAVRTGLGITTTRQSIKRRDEVMREMVAAAKWYGITDFFHFTDWPEKPFQKLSPSNKKAFLTMKEEERRRVGVLSGLSILDEAGIYSAIKSKKYGQIQKSWGNNKELIVAFKITLNRPFEAQKSFEKWLKTVRPKNLKVTETRGKSSQFYKSALRALGAYRLMNFMTTESAIEHTSERLGNPLYKESNYNQLWRQAKRQAEVQLATFASFLH